MPRGIPGSGKAAAKGAAAKRAAMKEPKVLKLTEVELLKVEKLTSQLRACDNEIVLTQATKNAYIQQIDPQGQLGKFDSKIQALKRERMEAEATYKELSSKVNARLGIDLKDYAYDDNTGVLRKIGEMPAAVPSTN